MAAKPKTAARRKATVRVSKKKRGISRLQVLVVASVLAVIGVVAVVASQASGTREYQYSWNRYCVSANGKTSADAVKTCKATSAEAMTYRLYQGLSGKSPDDGGYQFYTQKLAGERVKVTNLSYVVEKTAKMGSDTAFVKTLYKNMFMRDAKQKEVDQWVTRLKASGDKRWSRPKVVAQFATSKEAITKNDQRWTVFVASAPTVTVTQTAAAEQKARFNKMFLDYQQPATRDKEAAQSALNTAKALLTAAGKTADKNPPSAADLNSIAGNQANAGSAYNTASSKARAAAAKAAAAESLFKDAKELADFAPDIAGNQMYGIGEIAKRYRATKSAATAANSYAASTKARIDDIAKKYTAASNKYLAEQARLKAIADAKKAEENKRRSNGTGTGTGTDTDSGTDPGTDTSTGTRSSTNGGTTIHTCPQGFISTSFQCFNGVVGKYVGASANCPANMELYNYYTTRDGLKKKDCRTTKPRGSYRY